ncbi:histidine kinase [Paenibacillus sp. CC-CFT747]|nr:histidine kinase [Paenibacillus sp. CC-CFT747]
MALSLNAIVPSVDSVSSKISGSFYVLDRNLVIASSNDPKKLGEKPGPELETILLQGARSDSFRRDGEELIVHSEPIPEIGGRIVSVLPESELFQGLEEVQRLLLGMFVLLIAVMYVLYITITRNMLVPIQTFIAFIHKLRSAGLDHFHKRVPIEGYAEINILARQFNSLLDEIDDLTAKLVDSKTHIYELQLHKKQAELQYLKNQINPHFLYNTLETIKGIAYVKKVPEIRDMTDALSRVFRYSIKGEEEVQVRDELHIIKAYISIQQVRFGDRFDVRYEFSEPCLDVMILKMIMQPLVENAVFHGIEPSIERSVLTVGCRMENKRDLLLWVTDDGVGMEPAEREALTAGLEAANGEIPRAASQPHIGLRNVNNRIKYAYGPEYGIASIDSAPGRGTKVTVKVPAKGIAVYKVLLVDDEKWIVESLKGTVDWRALGYEVVGEAYNGRDALDKMARMRPDVAFIDIRMPGMNGIELIRQVSALGYPVLCIIASGYAEFDYARQAMQHGAVDYCLKPFDREEIERVLDNVKPKMAQATLLRQAELLNAMNGEEGDSSLSHPSVDQAFTRLAGPGWKKERGMAAVAVQGGGGEWIAEEGMGASLPIGRGKTVYFVNLRHLSLVKERFAAPALPQPTGVGISRPFIEVRQIRAWWKPPTLPPTSFS